MPKERKTEDGGQRTEIDKSFKRESRYVVLKITDIEMGLTDHQKNVLFSLCAIVEASRLDRGKSDFRCVVVEQDWPEYEPVWKMIENRMSGGGAE